jgi:copper chaperone CopZ
MPALCSRTPRSRNRDEWSGAVRARVFYSRAVTSTKKFGLVLVASAFLAVAAACDGGGATHTPGDSQTVVLSLQKVDCEGCMFNVITNVQKHEAVRTADFDLATAELTIAYDGARATPADLVALVERNGYQAVEGGGQGTFLPEVEFPADADVAELETAEALTLESHLVSDKTTVFDFYARWCQPCRNVDEHLAALVGDRSDIAVRRVDIQAWDSEIARTWLVGSRALPLLVVYGADGSKKGEVRGADTAKLDDVVGPAPGAPPASAPPASAPPVD